MKTSTTTRRKNLSGTAHQRALKVKHQLAHRGHVPENAPGAEENLSPEERAILKDQDFITEDEADLIMGRRAKEEDNFVDADEVFRELGIPRRRRTA